MSEETDEILRDIRRWVKIMGIQEARSVMLDALSADDPDEEEDLRIIYHLSDGDHSTRDIAEFVSVGKNAISSRQKIWSQMGLLEKEHARAPYEHVITLEEAGIEVPEIPETDKATAD